MRAIGAIGLENTTGMINDPRTFVASVRAGFCRPPGDAPLRYGAPPVILTPTAALLIARPPGAAGLESERHGWSARWPA
jgi:hypothetical protein